MSKAIAISKHRGEKNRLIFYFYNNSSRISLSFIYSHPCSYEALSGRGSGKVILDIILEIHDKFVKNDFQYHRDVFFIVYSNTFLQFFFFYLMYGILHWLIVLFKLPNYILLCLILIEKFLVFSNDRSILELMLCNWNITKLDKLTLYTVHCALQLKLTLCSTDQFI